MGVAFSEIRVVLRLFLPPPPRTLSNKGATHVDVGDVVEGHAVDADVSETVTNTRRARDST